MPRRNLTEKMVSRERFTRKGEKQTVIYDAGMPNLILKIGARTKTFFWDGIFQNERKLFKLGRFPAITLSEARELCRKHTAMIREGINPATVTPENITCEEVFEECVKSVFFRERSATTVEIQESYLRRTFLPLCGKMRIRDVHSGHIMDIVDFYQKQNKKGAAGHMRCALAKLFKFALQRRYIDRSPLFAVSPPKPPPPKNRVLTDAELLQAWKALNNTGRQPKQHALAIKLLMLLPVRGIELIGATWSEFDFENALWTIPPDRIKTKSSNPSSFVLPIPPLAFELLQQLREITGDNRFLFPSPKNPKVPISPKIIGRFIKRNLDGGIFEGMTQWTKHDLRRTIATNMGKLGIQELIISRCLNHKIRGITTRVYNLHQYVYEKQQAMRAWNDYFHLVLEPKSATFEPSSNSHEAQSFDIGIGLKSTWQPFAETNQIKPPASNLLG